MKKVFILFLFLFTLVLPFNVNAQTSGSSAFINVVNPIRGADFWDMQNQKPEEVVYGQIEILKQKNVPATWLIRYDALKNEGLLQAISTVPQTHEKGLFLEVTPTFTADAGVAYRESQYWHFAESVLLTGYEVDERRKLIDTSFEKFKSLYGNYPKSVGAWWIDGGSIQYMQEKYGVTAVLICADQYSTDNYQIWGQYWSTPYYPSKQNALYPAQEESEKLPVVMMQWASRDPVNGYGKGVEDSTFAVQANDYIDYHNLGTDYFAKLIDIYTVQKFSQFGEVVIGLENTYDWQKYKQEYTNQIQTVLDRQNKGQLQINTMSQFSAWYQTRFPELSPEHLIVADDPLGSDRKVVWYMNRYYRAGWFYNNQGSVFRDVRQYLNGEKEPCLEISCKAVNFATFKARTLDEVTYQDKWIVDKGRIKEFEVEKVGSDLVINYTTGTDLNRSIGFLPRDIRVDDQVTSIDTFILRAKEQQTNTENKLTLDDPIKGEYMFGWGSVIWELIKFKLFVLLGLFIPGFVLISYLKSSQLKTERLLLSFGLGITLFTLTAFLVGFLKIYWPLYIYVIGFTGFFIYKKLWQEFIQLFKFKFNISLLIIILIIGAGVFFQSLGVMRSGWVYEFGMGFWGPTGHDHIWHQALNNQVQKGIIPENPIFAGTTLTNYHYFFNVLVGASSTIFSIDSIHSLYRFFPIMFSILLGLGFFVLSQKLFKNIYISGFVLYFVYFGSSFGWIVDYLRTKTFGGESNFWINQPVSFNLNPPFAISIVLFLVAIILFGILLKRFTKLGLLFFVLVAGTLIEYKVYAGLIIVAGLLMVGIQQLLLFREFGILKLFVPTALLSALIFIPQNKGSADLIVFSPFWFIHSMVESPDRLGSAKIAEARLAYAERGEYFKLFLTEVLAFTIFIGGNLGTRVLALLLLPMIFMKKVRENLMISFILWMILISFSVPILFIQKGTPWNTIQFSYYGLYLSTLFVGVILYFIYKKLPKILSIPILVVVLLITPISSYSTFVSGFGEIPPARLSFGEMEGLNFLKEQKDGVVLTYPFDETMRKRFDAPFPLFAYETSSYVSAFSGKPTYIEDEIQMDIFQLDYSDRLVQSGDFFRGRDKDWSLNFLKQSKIKYVYLPKVYETYLEEETLGLKNIFENSQVIIYSVQY